MHIHYKDGCRGYRSKTLLSNNISLENIHTTGVDWLISYILITHNVSHCVVLTSWWQPNIIYFFLSCTDLSFVRCNFLFHYKIDILLVEVVVLPLLDWPFLDLVSNSMCLLIVVLDGSFFFLANFKIWFYQAENEADRMDWVNKITGAITSLFNSQFLQQVICWNFLKHNSMSWCPYKMLYQHHLIYNCCSLNMVDWIQRIKTLVFLWQVNQRIVINLWELTYIPRNWGVSLRF